MPLRCWLSAVVLLAAVASVASTSCGGYDCTFSWVFGDTTSGSTASGTLGLGDPTCSMPTQGTPAQLNGYNIDQCGWPVLSINGTLTLYGTQYAGSWPIQNPEQGDSYCSNIQCNLATGYPYALDGAGIHFQYVHSGGITGDITVSISEGFVSVGPGDQLAPWNSTINAYSDNLSNQRGNWTLCCPNFATSDQCYGPDTTPEPVVTLSSSHPTPQCCALPSSSSSSSAPAFELSSSSAPRAQQSSSSRPVAPAPKSSSSTAAAAPHKVSSSSAAAAPHKLSSSSAAPAHKSSSSTAVSHHSSSSSGPAHKSSSSSAGPAHKSSSSSAVAHHSSSTGRAFVTSSPHHTSSSSSSAAPHTRSCACTPARALYSLSYGGSSGTVAFTELFNSLPAHQSTTVKSRHSSNDTLEFGREAATFELSYLLGETLPSREAQSSPTLQFGGTTPTAETIVSGVTAANSAGPTFTSGRGFLSLPTSASDSTFTQISLTSAASTTVTGFLEITLLA